MNDWVLIALFAGLLWVRALSLYRFWKIPFSFGADRFFGLPVQASAAQPLLRRYRAMLFVPLGPDLLGGLTALYWGGLIGLLLEQVAALILTRVYHSCLAIHIIRQAKWLAVGDTWKPVRSVALLLKTRRLRDHTSLLLELILVLLMVVALALLTYDFRPGAGGPSSPGPARCFSFAALLIYLALGFLLLKHALVRWRMWLPGERTEEYLRWREAVLRYWLWLCDFLRVALIVGLVTFVLFVHLRKTRQPGAILPLALVVGGGFCVAAGVGVLRQQRRLRTFWKELQPLEAFSSPPQEIDTREFFLAGLCYHNPDNPALFVPGPLVWAVNLGNRGTYLYSTYLAGLLLLGTWCGLALRPTPHTPVEVPPVVSQE